MKKLSVSTKDHEPQKKILLEAGEKRRIRVVTNGKGYYLLVFRKQRTPNQYIASSKKVTTKTTPLLISSTKKVSSRSKTALTRRRARAKS